MTQFTFQLTDSLEKVLPACRPRGPERGAGRAAAEPALGLSAGLYLRQR